MSHNFGNNSDTENKYKVPNYNVRNQSMGGTGGTGPVAPGSSSPVAPNMSPPTPPPINRTTPGSGTTPRSSTGTRINPSTGTVPRAGTPTGTAPGAGMTTPGAGMRTTPGAGMTTPGDGMTTPGAGMTTPGAGMRTTPGTGMMPGVGIRTTPGTGMMPGVGIRTTPDTGMAPGAGMMPGAGNRTTPGAGMMPGAGMTPGSGMAPGANPMYQYAPQAITNMNYPPYQGIPNMYSPNNNPYQVPMAVPMFPLYGYDNSADLDRDVDYMKQLYPGTAKRIQKDVDDECDKMEYDGSMMFDEYPDREYLEKITDRIYDRIKDMDEEPQIEANSLYYYPPRRQPNYLRDVVSLLLLSEFLNRRRRYRSRHRWF